MTNVSIGPIGKIGWITDYKAITLVIISLWSRQLNPPKTGKIAVKVINHYGDEVLKVYGLEQGQEIA